MVSRDAGKPGSPFAEPRWGAQHRNCGADEIEKVSRRARGVRWKKRFRTAKRIVRASLAINEKSDRAASCLDDPLKFFGVFLNRLANGAA